MDAYQIFYLLYGPLGMFLTALVVYFVFGREQTGRR